MGGDPSCKHNWSTSSRYWDNRHASVLATEGKDKLGSRKDHRSQIEGSFCAKCGAWKGQLGLEPTPFLYVEHMVMIFREVKRVLKKTGSVYVVLGDTYAGSCSQGSQSKNQPYLRLYPQRKALQPKCLIGIPWRVAIALIDEDWILRNAIVWHKPNAMPSSVKDRLTCTYETIFHFVKSRRYYYDLDAIREPHKTAFAPFNLRVRDVKRGKGGISAFGELKASKEEVENYVYPESGRMKKFIQRIHEIAKRIRGRSCYDGKSVDSKGWKEVCSNAKAYRDALKILEQGENLTNEEKKFLQDYTQNHLGHPFGKNPGDIVLTKHDLAVGRVGNVRYRDPLHTKKYYPSGKNPGDVVGAKWSNVSGQLAQGNFGHGGTHGNRFNHPLGKNPGDIISSRYPPHEPRHFQLLKMGIPHGGHTGKTVRHDNPLGKNPGDVLTYNSKYAEGKYGQAMQGYIREQSIVKTRQKSRTEAKKLFPNNPKKQQEYINFIHDHDGHPLGRNPGDVIRVGMHHGSSLTSGRATHHEGQIIESHPLGKNPGDVIKVKKRIGNAHKGEATAGLYLPHKTHHELGKNPGDVIHLDRDKTAVEDFRARRSMRLPPEPKNSNAFHPKGKNPGDIIKTRQNSSKVMAQSRIHRYHSRIGIHQEGVNLGRYRYAKGGKNPGDVVKQVDEMMKRHPVQPPHHAPRIKLSDWNPHEWMQHPLGKNPGDIILEKGEKAGKANVKDGRLNDACPDCEGKVPNPCILDDTNTGNFWSITTKPFKGPHFAVYPEEICIKPIKSSCPPSGIVLDLMCGSGTTLVAAKKLGRKYVGFDINPKYVEIAKKRLRDISTKERS